jgi:hypothetical protein
MAEDEGVRLPELPGGPGRFPRWATQRESARQAALVAAWAAARPGVAFPVGQAACAVCRPLAFWLATTGDPGEAAGAGGGPGGRDEALAQLAALAAAMGAGGRARDAAFAALGRRQDGAAVLESHRALHVLLAQELADLWADAAGAPPAARVERARVALRDQAGHDALLAEPALEAFVDAEWDGEDGRPVLREPAATGGLPDRSRAFFLLHRHRFGAFVAATMGDYEQVRRRETGAAPGSLRLYDDRGRVLELTGVTAGYEGAGPRGTLWVLRAADLPEGDRGPDGVTDLERTVFGERAFRWPPDPGPRAR